MKCIATIAMILAYACLASCAAHTKLLTSDPQNGSLRPGEIVLVDDGQCPTGQIKQVIGGSNRVFGTDIRKPGTARQVTCIARP